MGIEPCLPVIKTCIPMGDDTARLSCKAGTQPNADIEFFCSGMTAYGQSVEAPGSCTKCKNGCYRPRNDYTCNMYCANGWSMRRRTGSFGEIPATFSLATTSPLAQYTCQRDYLFDLMNGYCEANVCPTENILPTIANEVTHDCGGGSTATSANSGTKG
jgi:hypothetical protein